MTGSFHLSSSEGLQEQSNRQSRICLNLKVRHSTETKGYDSIFFDFGQLIEEVFCELEKIDNTIEILPWFTDKNMTPLKPSEISTMDRDDISIYFHRLKAHMPFIGCDLQIKHQRGWHHIITCAGAWLRSNGHGMYIKPLQVENTRQVGCLIGSFNDLKFDLVKSLKQDHNIMVELRWVTFRTGHKHANEKPLRALQVWADDNNSFITRDMLRKIYSNENRIFPLGVKLEFVEGEMTLADKEKQGKFLSLIQSSVVRFVKSLDSSNCGLPTLRSLILSIKGRDKSPLFISVNSISYYCDFSITYLTQNKSEALAMIEILPTYILNEYGDQAKMYLKEYALSSAMRNVFESKQESLSTKRCNDGGHNYYGPHVDECSYKRIKKSSDEVLAATVSNSRKAIKPDYTTKRITDKVKSQHKNQAIKEPYMNSMLNPKDSNSCNDVAMADGFSAITIKLGILKQGAIVFRFIQSRYLDLHQANGTTGVKQLNQIVLTTFLDKNAVTDVELNRYHIELTFDDNDNDKIRIYSNVDIISALSEYSTIGKVKIMCKVEARSEQNDISTSHDTSIKYSPTATVADNIRFVHGRHTCEGCKTKPIIGKRFHCYSENFDACESCMSTYEGDEVLVEDQWPIDVLLQNFWMSEYGLSSLDLLKAKKVRFCLVKKEGA